MIDVFTPKRISPDCPFKTLNATKDQQNFRIWLLSVQFDSVVGCTPRSLTPWHDGDAHCRAWLFGVMHIAHHTVFWEIWSTWLRGVMHTAELDSAVWCTTRSFWKIMEHLTSQCDAHCTLRSTFGAKYMSIFMKINRKTLPLSRGAQNVYFHLSIFNYCRSSIFSTSTFIFTTIETIFQFRQKSRG